MPARGAHKTPPVMPALTDPEVRRVPPCVAYRDVFERAADCPNDLANVDDAKAICSSCPVKASCDALAEAVRPICGVWAGHLWQQPRPTGMAGSRMYGVRKR